MQQYYRNKSNYNTNDNNSDKNIIIIRNGYWWSPTATDGHQWLLMVMRVSSSVFCTNHGRCLYFK